MFSNSTQPSAVCQLFLLLSCLTGQLAAQEFPARPVTLIVPFARDLASDIAMRALADASSMHLGQQIHVRNTPGAEGTLGASELAREIKGDGHLLSQMSSGVYRLPHLGKVDFDPRKDFTWIIGITAFSYGIAVSAASPWKTWTDFTATARAQPGKITYAMASLGGTFTNTMERIAKKDQIDWKPALFKDGSQSLQALVNRTVDLWPSSTGWGEHIAAGKIRMLVSWSESRPTLWPEVPTLKELGYDIVVQGPYGIAGPRNMDPRIVKILHNAFQKGMSEPAFRATIAKLGQEPWYRNSEDYTRHSVEMYEAEGKRLTETRGGKQ